MKSSLKNLKINNKGELTLDKISNKFFKKFPSLSENVRKNIIIKYRADVSEALNLQDKEVIADIEEKNKKYNLKVICVLSNTLVFGKNSIVDIDEYIFISKECKPEIIDNNLLIYSESHNKTWGIADIGLLEITEENGVIKRVF